MRGCQLGYLSLINAQIVEATEKKQRMSTMKCLKDGYHGKVFIKETNEFCSRLLKVV